MRRKLWQGLEKLRSRSIFYRILCSYLLLFLVFVCGNILFYQISERNLREEIRAGSYVLLQKTRQELEDKVAGVRSVMEKIYLDETVFQGEVWKDSYDKLGMNSIYAMKTMLAQWRTDDMADLFVIFTNSGRAVSGVHGSTDAEDYLDWYYRPLEQEGTKTSREAFAVWEEAAALGSGRMQLRDQAGDAIMLAMRYPAYRTSEARAVITTVLRPEVVREIFAGVQSGTLLVYSKDGTLLASSGSAEAFADYQVNGEAGSYYTDNIQGEPCVVQVSVSETSGFQYVHVIPEAVFWSKQKAYFNTMLLSMGIFALVGCAMIAWLARANYRPWQELVQSIDSAEEKGTADVPKAENDYIQSAIEKALGERRKLYQKMQAERDLQMENRLVRFLRCEAGGDTFFGALEELGMQWNASFVLAGFQIESWDAERIPDLNAQEAFQQIRQRIESLLGSAEGVEGSFTVRWDRRLLITLIAVRAPEKLAETVAQTRNILEKSEGVTATAMLSGCVQERNKIPQLFTQLQQCAQYRDVFGRGLVIGWEQICTRKAEYRGNEAYMCNLILDWLENRNRRQSELDLIRIIVPSALDESTADAESFARLRRDLTAALRRAAGKEVSPVWEDTLNRLDCSETWLEYKTNAAAVLRGLRELRETEAETKSLPSQVAAYVGENYGNPDLNLNFLAELFSVSAQYLSKSFKAQHPEGIVEFIARTRVAHAKELLEQGEASVEAIGGECGFLSSASFIRTFKKLSGMTPGLYREHSRNSGSGGCAT